MSLVLHSDDVQAAARHAHDLLVAHVDEDWSVPAGGLEWDVELTTAHMAGAVAKYTLSLAARAERFIGLRVGPHPEATRVELARSVLQVADALAAVVDAAPPGSRGYHPSGMSDAEGFIGMACVELLVHAADVAAGLGDEFVPPDGLCRRVVDRLFPWTPVELSGWVALRWATGRLAVEGLASFEDDEWPWLPTPLEQWDGAMPTFGPEMPTGFRRSGETDWLPVYD